MFRSAVEQPLHLVDFQDLEFRRASVIDYTTCGHPFTRLVRVGMPRIPQQVLNAVFYLYKSREDAERGSNPGATGFIVHYNGTGDIIGSRQTYAVTNWHAAVRNGFSVIRVNKVDGGTDVIELDPSEWHFIPGKYDVAAVPVMLDSKVHVVAAIPTSIFIREKGWEPIGVGEDAFMIGLFLDHDGLATNVPSARFGHVSMLPNKKATIKQPTDYWGASFVLDMHSRTGFSGSPVFAYRTFGADLETTPGRGSEYRFNDLNLDYLDDMLRTGRIRRPLSGSIRTNAPFRMIGIHWGQFPEQWELKEKSKLLDEAKRKDLILDGAWIEGMSGMTCAIPSWQILEVLDMPSLKGPRDEEFAKRAEGAGKRMNPKAESATPSTDENPTHLEDFKSLVNAAARKQKQDE